MGNKVEKHFLVASLESGLSLMSEKGHTEGIASLTTALKSTMLEGVDITSMGLPKGEEALALMPDDGYWPDPRSWMAQYRPYNVKNGILTIPVRGVMLHGVSITFGRYFTGYEYVMRATQRAKVDPEVRNVVYLLDSNGGHVAGCFDTCDAIADIGKPTIAFIADFANSAGYAIAASCDKVIGTQTVMCGNIGVLRTHVDTTKLLDNIGIKYEYVTAPKGGDKSEGYPGTKVTAGQKDRSQSDVDEIYEIFIKTVTRKRKITAEQIRDTKAHSFQKEASLELGLIDMVASSVDILTAASEVFGSESFGEDDNRTIKAPVGANVEKPAEEDGTMTEEEMKAEIAKKEAEAKKQGEADGAAAAKKRIGDIMALPEAKGRETLANHIAFNTDMSADDAKAMLIASPVAEAPKVETTDDKAGKADKNDDLKKSFDDQMKKNSPNLSPNDKASDGDDDDKTKAAKSLEASKSLMARAGIAGYREAARQ